MKDLTLDKMKKVELDKVYIKSLLQEILNKNQPDLRRRRIIERDNELVTNCIICGDSSKSDGYKNPRAHIYYSNMRYVCYNSSECSCSFTSLLKKFNVDMDLTKKLELYDYIDQNVVYTHNKNDVQFDNLDKLFNVEDLMEFYKNDINHKITDLKPLDANSTVGKYIIQIRKISNVTDIFQGVYHISPTWKQNIIVFLNKVNNKVISFQVRNILDGDKRFFKIYDFSKIYKEMYPNTDLDDQERISYDKLSHFYNIFNIDFTQPVNMFEGYIDSLFLHNSIGMIGLNTDLSFLLKEDGIELRFIFDNDKPGQDKARKMLDEKHTIFLWNKFFLDYLDNYKGKLNKYELMLKLKDIKDFNALALKFKKPISQLFDFSKYFSNDDLDIYYLDNLEELYKRY